MPVVPRAYPRGMSSTDDYGTDQSIGARRGSHARDARSAATDWLERALCLGDVPPEEIEAKGKPARICAHVGCDRETKYEKPYCSKHTEQNQAAARAVEGFERWEADVSACLEHPPRPPVSGQLVEDALGLFDYHGVLTPAQLAKHLEVAHAVGQVLCWTMHARELLHWGSTARSADHFRISPGLSLEQALSRVRGEGEELARADREWTARRALGALATAPQLRGSRPRRATVAAL